MMISLIQKLLFPEPLKHPFPVHHKTEKPVITVTSEEPEGVISVNWGHDKVVKAVVNHGTDSIEWQTYEKGTKRLKPVELDIFDMTIIRQHQIKPNSFKLVKPYVLAGEWNNQEIATALGMSKSWVERLVPRVKAAALLRQGITPPLSHQ